MNKLLTKTELKERGWKEKEISYWLRLPDKIKRNFHRPSSLLTDKDCIKLYEVERVRKIEPFLSPGLKERIDKRDKNKRDKNKKNDSLIKDMIKNKKEEVLFCVYDQCQLWDADYFLYSRELDLKGIPASEILAEEDWLIKNFEKYAVANKEIILKELISKN